MVESFDTALNDLELMTIEELKKEITWPPDYLPSQGIIPYIKRLKGKTDDGVVGIEVGTGRGESTYHILSECKNVKKIYTIDPFSEYSDWMKTFDSEYMKKIEEIARKNLSDFGDRVEIIKEKSEDALKRFQDYQVDFIIIDGSQNAKIAYDDLSGYHNKLRVGGLFIGTNYNLNTIREAMFNFRNNSKARLPIKITSNNVWFWYK